MPVQFSEKHLRGFVSEHEFAAIAPQVEAAHELLHTHYEKRPLYTK